MEPIALEAQLRPQSSNKGELNRLRRTGQVPGTLYGKGMESVTILVGMKDVLRVLQSREKIKTPLDLTLDGAKHRVQITEVEMHPTNRTLQHIVMQYMGPEKAGEPVAADSDTPAPVEAEQV